MRQEFSNERGNDPRIWIKNLSGWKLTGNRTPTFAMTGPNALSIKLVEPTGEQAIVRSWYIRWWTWLSYLYRQFKILAISYFSVQIISTIGWLALKIERCVRSSQTSGFDYRSSLNFFRFFFNCLRCLFNCEHHFHFHFFIRSSKYDLFHRFPFKSILISYNIWMRDNAFKFINI